MTWYVTHGDADDPHPEEQIFTVSKDPTQTGWCNDSGCEGYGLTKAEADFLAQAANEKEARDGVEGPWETRRSRGS